MPFHPPEILGAAREAVVNMARTKIRLIGSSGLSQQFTPGTALFHHRNDRTRDPEVP